MFVQGLGMYHRFDHNVIIYIDKIMCVSSLYVWVMKCFIPNDYISLFLCVLVLFQMWWVAIG